MHGKITTLYNQISADEVLACKKNFLSLINLILNLLLLVMFNY